MRLHDQSHHAHRHSATQTCAQITISFNTRPQLTAYHTRQSNNILAQQSHRCHPVSPLSDRPNQGSLP